MKKLLLSFLLVLMTSLLTSCITSGEKYYQLTNNTSYQLSGSICEYDTYDNCIQSIDFHLDARQSTPSISASDKSKKVKIFLSDYNQWVADVYYLNSVFTINILLDNSTELINYEP